MNTRAGHYKSNLSGEMAYKSFVPNPLPPAPPIELSEDIISLLVKANSQLAVLKSVATRIPNVVFCAKELEITANKRLRYFKLDNKN